MALELCKNAGLYQLPPLEIPGSEALPCGSEDFSKSIGAKWVIRMCQTNDYEYITQTLYVCNTHNKDLLQI